MNKKFFAVMLFISVYLLSGCATGLLWTLNSPGSGPSYERIEVYTDEIQSAFEYKNVNLRTQSSSGRTGNIALPSEGVGFVGKDNVYFVTHNGNDLLLLHKLMKEIPLKAGGNSKYIDISLSGVYPKYGNGGFYQQINIKSQQPASSLTDEEKKQLTDASFQLTNGFYQRSVVIKGAIIKKSRFGGAIAGEASLNKSYQVRFYRDKYSSGISGKTLAFNLLMTPVTLTGDILLIPVYIVAMLRD